MTIAIDFDGVIHTYERGWADGTIYGDWTPNAMAAVLTLMERDAVFIHTTRNPSQVARWIEQTSGHGIDCTTHHPRTWYGRRKPFWNTRGLLLVTDRKLPATVYIDDRAHHFETWDKTMVALGEPAEDWPSASAGLCDVESVGGERCTRDDGHRLHSFEVGSDFQKVRQAIRQLRGEIPPQRTIRFGPCNDEPDGGEAADKTDELRCVCGAPAVRDGDRWTHQPGTGDSCVYRPYARPRCPDCRLPHDLTPDSMAVRACTSILTSLAGRAAPEARQDGAQTKPAKPPTAYSDGKGRVFCLKCAPTATVDVPLTPNDVDPGDLCASCERNVVDAAHAVTESDTQP